MYNSIISEKNSVENTIGFTTDVMGYIMKIEIGGFAKK